jgi:hypothetical protein
VDLCGLLLFGFRVGRGELLARDETGPYQRDREDDDAIDQPDRHLAEIEGLRMICASALGPGPRRCGCG